MLLIALIWDYMSAAAVFFFTAKTVELLVTFFLDGVLTASGIVWYVAAFVFAIWALIMFAHRKNIRRLINGTENKSKFKQLFQKKERGEGAEDNG
jgi:glycerol-3-phosphate acyltransferase PlsY